jgi:N-formylglutamate amidohydrolase
VELNNPYSGCIIPSEFYETEKNVKGIMIEINKRLYMDGERVNREKVGRLNMLMSDFFENL